MQTYGWLLDFPVAVSLPVLLSIGATLGFRGASLGTWTAFIALVAWSYRVPPIGMVGAGMVLLVLNVKFLRQILVSSPIMRLLRVMGLLPSISQTEKTALEAGATWIDKELFSGRPDFHYLLKQPYNKISADEKLFLDGPVDEVCRMVDDWEVYKHKDLPESVWDFVKKERFFGMIIPKEYGGLGLSAIGNSEVIHRLASRCVPLAVTVMVPNSLGPGELILHYGTKKQKLHYLPRLASGEEIPCFALTEPQAGSDAGSLSSSGEVFKGEDGQLYLRLNWNKRYITLAAVATIIGLAVRVRDPKNLLGKGEDIGITCVLVPANAPGVALGKRHNPMGVPFYNCPTKGVDVVVSVDQIIGGVDGAGKGWRMLMESLAAGRSISLPAQSTGGAKGVARVVSAYSRVRHQFGLPIAKFEGIEEPLARIYGLTYLLEATRIYTCGAVDSGIKPAVVSAIAKYNATELWRKVINDGMDILGGAAISRGPRNLLANGYIATPIGITVEGANILTRTMIIFGQGAIRCHPYAYRELKALEDNDLAAFDAAFFGHIGFVIRNGFRAGILSLSRGRFGGGPGGPLGKYYRKLAWSSASFAFFSDVAMGTLGGSLKLREKLTGRYADVLSWMYLATSVLRRYEAEGRKSEHKAFAEWALQYAFSEIQLAFDGIFRNFRAPVVGWVLKHLVAPWSKINSLGSAPSDKLGHEIVQKMMEPGDVRESLTGGIFLDHAPEESAFQYEEAFSHSHAARSATAKIKNAIREGRLQKTKVENVLTRALEVGVISAVEAELIEKAVKARQQAIQVDAFDLEDYSTGHLESAS